MKIGVNSNWLKIDQTLSRSRRELNHSQFNILNVQGSGPNPQFTWQLIISSSLVHYFQGYKVTRLTPRISGQNYTDITEESGKHELPKVPPLLWRMPSSSWTLPRACLDSSDHHTPHLGTNIEGTPHYGHLEHLELPLHDHIIILSCIPEVKPPSYPAGPS